MTHRYLTRFQAARLKENRIKMILVNQAIDRKNHLMEEVSKVNTYAERLEKLIRLYEYVRDTPILMDTLNGFREDVWEKLNILEELLLEKSQKIDPSVSEYDRRVEKLIDRAFDVIEDIRAEYW
jgi:nicotinate-nucleotide pyrophosphorylase